MAKHKRRNPVARHLKRCNQAVVHIDRKKAQKKGYKKHHSQGDVKVAA
jgi:hypothetical protein